MPITATLAWLAKEKRIDFDAYFAGRSIPEAVKDFFPIGDGTRNFIDAFLNSEDIGLGWMAGIAPFRETHLVDVYYLLSQCSVFACTNAIKIRKFLGALRNSNFISARKSNELSSFYNDIFSYFKMTLPEKAVMVPSTPFQLKNKLLIESYCYPDIFFSKKLGLDSSIPERELEELRKLGIREISLLYCSESAVSRLERHEFKVKIIDTLQSEDTYGTVTKRIFDRWRNKAKGVAYSDPNLTQYWTPFFCRNNLIAMFDLNWKSFVPTLAACADQTNSKIIFGRQLSDDFIPLLSKYDKIFAIIDAGRPPITIKPKIPYTPAHVVETPWNKEISDDRLLQAALDKRIPTTVLLYASDIRHLTIAPSFFPLAPLMRVKLGVAVPISFYEYVPEWMDELYTSYEVGGSLPYIEPLICSAGLGVATEAEGYLSRDTLVESLIKTRQWISKKWGKAAVPIGYYPFQDACPFYKHDTADPQFEAIRSAGFQYYVTYKDEGKFPRVVYENGDFIAINQQTVHWTRNPLEDLKNWEEKITSEDKNGWIIISLDSPFWGFMFYEMKNGKMLIDVLDFIKEGGSSGKLFSATPHEIVRYAKIVKTMA